MFRIFISYRRGDTRDITQRLYERIRQQFGSAVFCDVSSFCAGDDFRQQILQAADNCDAMLVVIGQHWFGCNPDGSRRIDDPNDWVFQEINHAIDRNITVLPVLIHPARHPAADELPAAIRELAFRESLTIYNDRQFESSVRTVIDSLVVRQERHAGSLERLALRAGRSLRTLRQPFALTALLSAVTTAVFLTWWLREKFDGRGRRVDSVVANTWEQADRMKLEKEIEAMRARPAEPVTERPANTAVAASLGSPDYSSFDILSDERFWDLRGWKDLSQKAVNLERSLVVMTRTARILKAAPAQELRFEARTDGTDVFLTSLSHRSNAFEVLQEQTGFVGARSTKVRQLVLDVEDVPTGEEFLVRTRATYVDSLQDPLDRWIGAIGYPRSDRIRMIVLMPADRPLLKYRLQTAPSTRDDPAEYTGPLRLIEAPDRLSLMWEIPNPAQGFVYSIVMEW